MSRDINLYSSLGLEAFEFLFSNRHILIFGMLEAADKILALNNDVAHRTIVLIAHARAALVVQQVKRNVLAFRRGVNADGDRH